MNSHLKKTFSYLLQPQVILFVISFCQMFYVGYVETQINMKWGCYDCGYETRQALFLFVGSAALFIPRFWRIFIALPLSLKVVYAVGEWAFFNNIDEVEGLWEILKASVKFTYHYHPRTFVEVTIGLLIILFSFGIIWQMINNKVWKPK